MSEIALQLVMRALSSSNMETNTSLLPTHTGDHLPRHHFSSESWSNALPVIAIEVKGEGLPFSCTNGRLSASERSERDTYRGKNEKIGDVCLFIYWRASVASETLSGVTQSRFRYIYLFICLWGT